LSIAPAREASQSILRASSIGMAHPGTSAGQAPIFG
jgi:hypothetical protein